MKFRATTNPSGFQPITFSVTIESERELELWWAISNASNKQLVEFLNACNSKIFQTEEFFNEEQAVKQFRNSGMWDFLNRELRRIK